MVDMRKDVHKPDDDEYTTELKNHFAAYFDGDPAHYLSQMYAVNDLVDMQKKFDKHYGYLSQRWEEETGDDRAARYLMEDIRELD